MQYAAIDPFGEERADFRSAQIVAMLANVNRDSRKTRPFTISDFMPQFERGSGRKPMDSKGFAKFKEDLKASRSALTGAKPK